MLTRLRIIQVFLFAISLFSGLITYAQTPIEKGDPPNSSDIPDFYKSTLTDLEEELNLMQTGKKEIIATSPGGLPVYAVFYGEKSQGTPVANYNSAVAARQLSSFLKKDNPYRPVLFFLGPVHGQEAEGLVGLINLIHIAETGKDHRGKDYMQLKRKLDLCRIIVVPCGNPDGRRRCPYDSFLGLPTRIMTKYGQGTRKDGTSWGWPGAKSLHPMEGDVLILGAYFNDEGINLMHDDFFAPMAGETRAILDLARSEAPDMTVSLHSHEHPPRILQANYEPWFMKQHIDSLTRLVNQRYTEEGLSAVPPEWLGGPALEDEIAPSRASFNLISALHHVSGTMAFTFECSHGSLSDRFPDPIVSYEDILDIQLILYDEMLDYALERLKPAGNKTEFYHHMDKIDAHVHIRTADPAVMEFADAEGFRLLTINTRSNSQTYIDQQRESAMKMKELYPDELSWLCTFSMENFEEKGWAAEVVRKLQEDLDQGASGFKIWKDIGMTFRDSLGQFVYLDDKRFEPILKFMEASGLPLLTHIAEPRNCWLPVDSMTVNGDKSYFTNHPEYHMYLHPDYPSHERLMESRDHVLANYPDLHMIGAHFGSLEWDVDVLAERLDRYPNFAVDMAARVCHLQVQEREKVRNFIVNYQDRLLYATDMSVAENNFEERKQEIGKEWQSDWAYFATDSLMRSPKVDVEFSGLDLDRKVLEKIYHSNALNWYPGTF